MSQRIYGHNKTVHQNRYLDVEVDEFGVIISVWFRCLMLPFRVTQVTETRVKAVTEARRKNRVQLLAVEIEEE